jgi:hypothetical protein
MLSLFKSLGLFMHEMNQKILSNDVNSIPCCLVRVPLKVDLVLMLK